VPVYAEFPQHVRHLDSSKPVNFERRQQVLGILNRRESHCGQVQLERIRVCVTIEIPWESLSLAMKPGIHPAYEEVNVTCACGHKFRTRSAHKGDIRVEICSNCHPFFTGKQKLIDTEGRVDRFQKKYQKVRDAAEAKKKQPVA
jgi:large subunit ribosomal protein L31